MRNETNELIATIEQKEGRYFLLRLADGQSLNVPIHSLSKTARVGEIVHLRLLTEVQAKHDKAELARSLLEEILNGSES